MNMLRYYPWSVLSPLQHEAARVFTRRAQATPSNATADSEWAPAVDIREEADRYVILADVPGIEAKDIEIQTEHGVLSIKGARTPLAVEERNLYKRVERLRGSFERRFTLPDAADTAHISASSHSGVLEVVIPKAQAVQPRKIVVTG
jgi:HSP20 family protein